MHSNKHSYVLCCIIRSRSLVNMAIIVVEEIGEYDVDQDLIFSVVVSSVTSWKERKIY